MSAPNDYAKLVRVRVAELGLSERELVENTGLSAAELYDIQHYSNELSEAVPLSFVRRLMTVLGWNTAHLVETSEADSSGAPVDVRTALARGDSEELADRLGYDTKVVEAIKADFFTLDEYPLVFAVDLAHCLGVSPSAVIASLEDGARTDG